VIIIIVIIIVVVVVVGGGGGGGGGGGYDDEKDDGGDDHDLSVPGNCERMSSAVKLCLIRKGETITRFLSVGATNLCFRCGELQFRFKCSFTCIYLPDL
jgi:hypothetical protein